MTKINPEQVSKLVLDKLGTPENFYQSSAANVFGNYWRVNIRVKTNQENRIVTTTSIIDSFLVKIDGNKIADGDTVVKKYTLI